MLRYEVLDGELHLGDGWQDGLSFMLPVREAKLIGFCAAGLVAKIEGGRAAPPAVSITVGDGQPVFEGFLSVLSPNRRVHFMRGFIDLRHTTTSGAELRITPICPNARDGGKSIAIALILQYDAK